MPNVYNLLHSRTKKCAHEACPTTEILRRRICYLPSAHKESRTPFDFGQILPEPVEERIKPSLRE